MRAPKRSLFSKELSEVVAVIGELVKQRNEPGKLHLHIHTKCQLLTALQRECPDVNIQKQLN